MHSHVSGAVNYPSEQRSCKLPSDPTLQQPIDANGLLVKSSDDVTAIATAKAEESKSWPHFVAGACGGITSTFLTNPLDVLKTRLQSDFYQSQLIAARAARGIPTLSTLSIPRSAALHIRETFQILFAVPQVEGWRALFKGLGPNLTGVVPARAINFFTYGNGKRIISQEFNNGKEAVWVHLSAAATAGIVTGSVTCPIWVIKTRLQLDRSHAHKIGVQRTWRYKNAVDCTMQTLRHEGVRGLYRGLGASYLGVAESTLQWVLYEQMKLSLKQREERVSQRSKPPTASDHAVSLMLKAGAAGTAKLIAAALTYPHEVVRTRLRQAPMANGQVKYTGIIQCVRLVCTEEGVVALYGGLVPHIMRVVPSACIMFGVYEGVLKLLGTSSNV